GTVDALNRAAKLRHASGAVFLDAQGQLIAEKVLEWAVVQVYKTAKIAGCNFRSFRHTMATRALRRGVPVPVVARMMGHSSTFITDRYMHVKDDQLEAAAEAMSGPERLAGRESEGRGRMPPASVPGSATAPPTAPPEEAAAAGTA